MVRVRGLEPPRLAATAPKAVVSTNSTILALTMEESMGFEPMERLHVLRISNPALSATQPTLQHQYLNIFANNAFASGYSVIACISSSKKSNRASSF